MSCSDLEKQSRQIVTVLSNDVSFIDFLFRTSSLQSYYQQQQVNLMDKPQKQNKKNEHLFKDSNVNHEEMLSVRKKVQIINIFECTIGRGCLSKHLNFFSSLKQLWIRGCNLGDTGTTELRNLTNLKEMCLANNQIGDEGAKHISAIPNLNLLILGINHIGDEGALNLSKMVYLKDLYVGKNKIGNRGASSLLKMPSLKFLFIKNNQLTSWAQQRFSTLQVRPFEISA